MSAEKVTELEVMLYEALRAFRDGGPEGGTDFNGWHQSYEEPCRLAREALAAYESKKAPIQVIQTTPDNTPNNAI